jgi:hypothetical protein
MIHRGGDAVRHTELGLVRRGRFRRPAHVVRARGAYVDGGDIIFIVQMVFVQLENAIERPVRVVAAQLHFRLMPGDSM